MIQILGMQALSWDMMQCLTTIKVNQGARVLEKHIGLKTIPENAYNLNQKVWTQREFGKNIGML